MEFILEKGEEYILISEQSHLNELVNRINNGIFLHTNLNSLIESYLFLY